MQCSDLGLSYDEHLSYTSDLNKIVNKAAGRAKCILKCFPSRDSVILTRSDVNLPVKNVGVHFTSYHAVLGFRTLF